MIPQFTNIVSNSFLLWAENHLLNKAQAYKNYTSRLYYNKDLRLEQVGYMAYASPFKQWVYDFGVSGATICTGISGSINLDRGISGLKIDYNNGRVLLPSSFGTGLILSGSYAFKDLNIYFSNETQESLMTTTKFFLNSRFNRQPTGAIPPYIEATPALFFNNLNSKQEPYALGGIYNTQDNVSFVIMAENVWMLDAVISFFRDATDYAFPQIDIFEHPIDQFGDVKTGLYPSGYNYQNLIAQYGQPGNLIYITEVVGSKVSDKVKASDALFLGLIDIEVSKIRTKT